MVLVEDILKRMCQQELIALLSTKEKEAFLA